MDAKTEAHIRHIVEGVRAVAISSHPPPTGTEVITALNRAERGQMPDINMRMFIALVVDAALYVDMPITLKIAHKVAQLYRGDKATQIDFDELSPRWREANVRLKLGSLALQGGCMLLPMSNDSVSVVDEAAKTARTFNDPDELHRFLLSRAPADKRF